MLLITSRTAFNGVMLNVDQAQVKHLNDMHFFLDMLTISNTQHNTVKLQFFFHMFRV